MGTAREALVEQLKPALPKDWKIVEHQRNLDRLAQTTVVLKQESIAKLTAAPLHWLHVTFTITIIDPGTDVVQAEEALDDDVLALCHALDQIDGLTFDTATKVLYDQHLAYDITVQLPTFPSPKE